MDKIEILENDSQLMTVKIGDRVLVYNKGCGYWYGGDADKIVRIPADIENRIWKAAKYSNDLIEDMPDYVYHPDGAIL